MKEKNELTIIQSEEFGIESAKAKTIEQSFLPKKTEIDSYSEQYSTILTKELNKETFKEARELRLKLVKLRTGIADVHKSEKAFFLASGKFVDALKNKLTVPIEQMEEKLKEIEEYEKRQETIRKEALRNERILALEPYGIDTSFLPLGDMTEEQFQGQLDLSRIAFEQKQEEERIKAEAERKAEEDRIEAERLNKLERDRRDILAPYFSFIDWDNISLSTQTEKQFKDTLDNLKRIKAEHDAEQEKIRIENDRLKEEQERKDREAKAEQERLKKIADDLEKEKRDREDKERKEKEEQERKAKELANAGDKVKFKIFFNKFKDVKFPELDNIEITESINSKIEELRKFMIDQSKKLL